MSLIDMFKNVDGKGRLINVIEVLNNTSQGLLDDWVWMECNSGTKHTRSIRTGLPSVSWGALYEGIPQSKSTKQQVDDTTGFVEATSPVDKRQLKHYGENAVALRQSEAVAFLESMSQELMTAMFYHNPATNPRYPKGLGARFGVLAASGAGNQIIDAGGSGSDNTSVWFVDHSYDGLSVIFPTGTVGGIERENMGPQRATDALGNPYYIEEEVFRATVGFSVGDWRRIVRVANVDVSDLQAGTVDMFGLLRKAWYKWHIRRIAKVHDQTNPGRGCIYCNRDVLEALDRAASNGRGPANDNFTRLTWGEVEGREVLTYRGIPIRETDAILNTEARIV
jgi:hypothetical protein